MSFPARLCLSLAMAGILGCSRQAPAPDAQLEVRRQEIQARESKTSEEGEARKARSIAILKAEKVPFIEHLPAIETESESKRRTTEEVAARAMALCFVALKAEGLEQEIIDEVVQEYRIESAFTPLEAKFIKDPKPSQHDRAQFAWRYECYTVMLWALGFIDTLDRPEKICDVPRVAAILKEHGRDGFLKKAKLRSQAELLDAADLIYRYHWATVDARVQNSQAPAGLNGEVIMERHHALNWLIGHLDQAWDDVSTDT